MQAPDAVVDDAHLVGQVAPLDQAAGDGRAEAVVAEEHVADAGYQDPPHIERIFR